MSTLINKKLELGTMPVFLTSIATILGAILFLRFGFAVANTGFLGTILIIVIAHLVTIPTALAVSEIATNQKVEGGGLYYIISRSFGTNIGAAIGITLYLSQAISIAFYGIAFAEAFEPVYSWVNQNYGLHLADPRWVSLPVTVFIMLLMLLRGADIGIKFLYIVIVILAISLLMFFLGHPLHTTTVANLTDHVEDPMKFFKVFAICFPAFTGIAAGIGLSGDLKDAKRSIPLGTIAATIVGMVVYIFVAWKLYVSASLDSLNNNQLIMADIALWGPAILIGLGASTLSSAIGSAIIAPRTLQAIANDKVFPSEYMNTWLAKGSEKSNEPFNSSAITAGIALFFILIGNVNFVAEIITMFFMVTYGSICLISFLEHFAADPSYRPTFKSRWVISLVGAVLCVLLMFQINVVYALIAIAIMVIIYFMVTYMNSEVQGMSMVFQGVMFQLNRRIQLTLQTSETQEEEDRESWRPAVVCISRNSFKRFAAFDMLRWIAHKYGFGTYIHLIEDYLSKKTHEEASEALERLKKMAESSRSNVFLDTLISPSYTSAIAQVIQLPGISGKENNMLMFEFSKDDPDNLDDIVNNFALAASVNFDIAIIGSSGKGFGYKSEIHIWITSNDYENANMMILLGYIILGHPEWRRGQIKIFAIYPEAEIQEQKGKLLELITSGRLPISANNVNVLVQEHESGPRQVINQTSQEADLTILGFRSEALKRWGTDIFKGYDSLSNVLFINSGQEKEIRKL